MGDAYITLIILIFVFYTLVRDLFTPAVSFISGLALLVIFGVIDESTALKGFSNDTIFTIGALFIMAHGAQKAIDTEKFLSRIIGSGKRVRLTLLRLMGSVAAASAVLNNTPLVAMLISPLIDWSKRRKIPAGMLLIPLSFAAVAGGTLTLIGTSTNLVVSGFMQSYGLEGFSFFQLTAVSLPAALVAIVITALLTPKILGKGDLASLNEKQITKRFTLDATPKSSLFGKTVEDAKLRHLKEVFLSSILRANGDVIAPVGPETTIRRGDTLRFSGNVEALIDFEKDIEVKLVGHKHADINPARVAYFEAVVGQNKSIAGNSLSEIGFRSKYQAAVLAIFRSGEKIDTSLGQTELKPGDSLLLTADQSFLETWQDRQDFLFIREITRHKVTRKKQGQVMTTIFGLVLALLIFGVPLSFAVIAGALATITSGILTPLQAKNSIDWDILLMIGAAIGVAQAVDSSGLAHNISDVVISVFGGLGAVGLLIGIVITTSILTELLTNAAAALLVLPIAITTAQEFGLDPMGFAVAIAIISSMSFISPFGYQTNTMVYSAGGYKVKDFVKIGTPITITSIAIVVAIVNLLYFV